MLLFFFFILNSDYFVFTLRNKQFTESKLQQVPHQSPFTHEQSNCKLVRQCQKVDTGFIFWDLFWEVSSPQSNHHLVLEQNYRDIQLFEAVWWSKLSEPPGKDRWGWRRHWGVCGGAIGKEYWSDSVLGRTVGWNTQQSYRRNAFLFLQSW